MTSSSCSISPLHLVPSGSVDEAALAKKLSIEQLPETVTKVIIAYAAFDVLRLVDNTQQLSESIRSNLTEVFLKLRYFKITSSVSSQYLQAVDQLCTNLIELNLEGAVLDGSSQFRRQDDREENRHVSIARNMKQQVLENCFQKHPHLVIKGTLSSGIIKVNN
ncbi:MAG: hypothetical protein JWO53_951 [Chlamydiia bacterium]|nr:hypothetical protein [Chlamydiia bacterium]